MCSVHILNEYRLQIADVSDAIVRLSTSATSL